MSLHCLQCIYVLFSIFKKKHSSVMDSGLTTSSARAKALSPALRHVIRPYNSGLVLVRCLYRMFIAFEMFYFNFKTLSSKENKYPNK